ncbi:glycosyltransferase [Flavobacterium terrisoli]|uniref:glycosyltransferase n=1 Tax=Flavobacterium terrisoli TaxID=3242195 RepID=UPI002543D903|nr:glycosyltransferase [Flavobacterium buctense]
MSVANKRVLFITWDGPQTSYMEGLFMPILSEVQKNAGYAVHVIQFTWGTKERIAITQKKAEELNINYTAKTILRKPIAALGSLLTLYSSINYLKNYIRKHKIDIVMPRSTMPSIMVNRLKKTNFQILFDADGLPLEERVDFSGLKKTSRQYRFLKQEENKMLSHADGVITRSNKSIAIHLKTLKGANPEKFSLVYNGRNIEDFKPNDTLREAVRTGLHVENGARLFVYCGSLGPQYGWDQMLAIFQRFQQNHPNAKFLILTGNIEFAQERIPEEMKESILLKKVPFGQVPKYLSAGDIAFAIREPKFSMQGVAPIKLGEYFLMGIPTIASAGIGDTEELIKEAPDSFLFHHDDDKNIANAVAFAESLSSVNHDKIREFGIQFFSVEKSAESYIKALEKLS